jgi:hypothetical protein
VDWGFVSKMPVAGLPSPFKVGVLSRLKAAEGIVGCDVVLLSLGVDDF